MKELEHYLGGPKNKDVFRQIYIQGMVSRQQLGEDSSLTGSTLNRVLDDLVSEGWIHEVGLGESSGGRRPILYETAPRKGLLLGLDISRLGVRLVLCDMCLRCLESEPFAADAALTPERLLDFVDMQTRRWMDGDAYDPGTLLGIGVGAVGPLDAAKGMIVDPLHFPAQGWESVPIGSLLSERLGVPAVLDNGANAAVWGEYLTAVRKADHMLYVNAGNGLRSSFIADGQVIHGSADTEGGVGQMIIQMDGLPSRDAAGNYGSWESYASIHALERMATSAVRMGRRTIMAESAKDGIVSFAGIRHAVAEGDAVAMELLQQCANAFGIGLANLINVMHPEKVILGGPLVSLHPLFYMIAIQTATSKTYHYPRYVPVFGKSSLEDEAIAVGAAALLLRRIWK